MLLASAASALRRQSHRGAGAPQRSQQRLAPLLLRSMSWPLPRQRQKGRCSQKLVLSFPHLLRRSNCRQRSRRLVPLSLFLPSLVTCHQKPPPPLLLLLVLLLLPVLQLISWKLSRRQGSRSLSQVSVQLRLPRLNRRQRGQQLSPLVRA